MEGVEKSESSPPDPLSSHVERGDSGIIRCVRRGYHAVQASTVIPAKAGIQGELVAKATARLMSLKRHVPAGVESTYADPIAVTPAKAGVQCSDSMCPRFPADRHPIRLAPRAITMLRVDPE